MEQQSRGIWGWQIVKYVVGASLLCFCAIQFIYGWTEEGVRHEIRWTGRVSFVLFCLAFAASGLHSMIKNSLSWWLLMNRKYFGISFAIIHLIHLCYVALLQYFFHPVFDQAATISLFGGGVAYGFTVAMLITSFDVFKQKLYRSSWKVLHSVGGYWIWFIFLSTYWNRIDEPIHWIFVIVLIVILLLRLRMMLRKN